MMETAQITDMDAFASAIKQRMEQAQPFADVEIQKVPQNNNLTLTGIAIREKGRNIAPAIYLEGFFEEYRNGKPLDEICRKIMEIHRRMNPGRNFDVSRIKDFSNVKQKICYKLVNAEKNAARLEEVPHRLWQDLAVIYYVPVSIESVNVFSSIMVDNKMMESWGVDEDTLYRQACMNTPKLFKAEIMPLSEVLKDMSKGMDDSEEGMPEVMDSADMPQLYVATNDRKINGASVLLYDGVLEGFAEQTGGDFYILPSSIHETLFLPATPDVDENDLPEMVCRVNAGCLDPDEILSDNAYLYHAEDGSVTLVS